MIKKLFDFTKRLYQQYRETFWYLVFGALTTALNLGVFYFLFYICHVEKATANVIAWIAGVLFAFVTNKLFVFESSSWKKEVLFRELVSFVAARLFSGIFDTIFLMFFTEWVFHWNAMLIKIISNILVIIMNYVFSKWFVFRKKKE